MPGLSDKRLLFVTGKGGVGKSTVAIALGIAAARRGQRTLVAELGGQERAATAFDRAGLVGPGEEVELDAGLFAISIDPQRAMEEYLRRRTGALGDLLSASRAFGAFAQATPGMSELLSIGKLWELTELARRTPDAEPYDLVILDAPATGHAVGLLRTPRTFAEIARVGPIANQGRAIDASFSDPDVIGVVAVALAEEMPVNETIELSAALREQVGLPLAEVVANALVPTRLGPRQTQTVRDALDRAQAPLARAALRAALAEQARTAAQEEQLERLREATGLEPVPLPRVIAPALDLPALDTLATALEGLL